VVLAEAAKQTELKTGHPLKGIEIPTSNGINGHHKKEEEPPAIQEPPEILLNYFDRELDFQSLFTSFTLLQVSERDLTTPNLVPRQLNCFTWPQSHKKSLSYALTVSVVLTFSTSGIPSVCRRNIAFQITFCR